MADSIWKKSADPKQRAKAYKGHEKAGKEREMRTTNVVRQSAMDKLLHRDGKMGKR